LKFNEGEEIIHDGSISLSSDNSGEKLYDIEKEFIKKFDEEIGELGQADKEDEELINKYMGFSMDGTALFYTMIYTWQIWLFYDNSKFADIYGIARADMIFYFWFGVVIIPF
jgi:hypothetical protein